MNVNHRYAIAGKLPATMGETVCPGMTLKRLHTWHETEGIAALKRAKSASTKDCRDSNLAAQAFHYNACLLLSDTMSELGQ